METNTKPETTVANTEVHSSQRGVTNDARNSPL